MSANLANGFRLWLAGGCALWLALTAPASAQPEASADSHVIIISIDSLLPEYYLPGKPSQACPTLAGLRRDGSYAERALSVYPSLTYPAHASIATGVYPARHGISANDQFNPPRQNTRGYWYERDLKAPAIWKTAHQAGLSVAAFSWPVSAGSKSIAWNLPEFWSWGGKTEREWMDLYAGQEFMQELEGAVGPITLGRLGNAELRDTLMTQAAVYVLERYRPHLLFLHLLESDHEQHKRGRSSPQLRRVMRRQDQQVARVIAACKKAGLWERTTLIILGDHGSAEVHSSLAPNVLLMQAGLLTVEDRAIRAWKAMAQNTGCSAGVYLNPAGEADLGKQVLQLFREHQASLEPPAYRIIDRAELTRRGGPTRPAFYLEAEPGYMFSGSLSGQSFVRPAAIAGNHGGLPDRPGLETGFIAAGRGIRKNVKLPEMHLVDVAPTLAALLGLPKPDSDGRVLQEILE